MTNDEKTESPLKTWTVADLMANPPKPWVWTDHSVYRYKKDQGFEGASCIGTWTDSGAKFVIWQRQDRKGLLIERYNAYPNDQAPAEYMHIHGSSLRPIVRMLTMAADRYTEE